VGGGYLTQNMMKAFTRGRRISYPKDDEGIHSIIKTGLSFNN
jgi:hypothetical protein